MRDLCHRCGGDLPSGDEPTTFCPHCGAPQLFLTEAYLAEPDASADTTGAPPPPLPRQVDWKAALSSAAAVAGVAALLAVLSLGLPSLWLLSSVWVLSASMSTLALYQLRRPLAWMDAGIGARIGLAAGLVVAALLTLTMAAAGLAARYDLHAMASFDLALVQLMTQAKSVAAASATPVPADALRLYDIPEFQAGLLFTSIAIGAAFLLLFNTCGGALGGLLRTRNRRRA